MLRFSTHRPTPPYKRRISAGHTVVELMVVAAIIGIISVAVIIGQSSFNRTLILSNTAADIALSLRTAQSLGVGSRGSGTTYNAGYGLHFTNTPNNSYTLFADISPAVVADSQPNAKPGDNKYTAVSDTLMQTFTLNNGMTINTVCANDSASTKYCWGAGGGGILGLTKLSIVFSRPNTFATFTGYNGVSLAPNLVSACIRVRSPQLTSRYITISQVGQIVLLPPSTSACP